MSWNTPDVYYNPEHFGLEQVGTMDLQEPDYSFDILLVVRDPETGEFFIVTDSGCSCPSPFEDFTSRDKLGEPLTAAEAAAKVKAAAEAEEVREWRTFRPNSDALVSAIMDAPRRGPLHPGAEVAA